MEFVVSGIIWGISELFQKTALHFRRRADGVDATAEQDNAFGLESVHANTSRPFGSGMGRPSDFAVSIHSLMMTSAFLSAAWRVGPSAAQPGSSGTSAMK